MKNEESEPKIGAGHAAAMFRQGLSELRGMLYSESNVAQPAQYGLYGTRTPGEVMQDRGVTGRDLDERPMEMDERAGPEVETPEKKPVGRDEPELNRE